MNVMQQQEQQHQHHTQHGAAGGGRHCFSALRGISATESSPNALIGGMKIPRSAIADNAPASRRLVLCADHGRRRCDGFSLTEILIVIALIVLILALALPAFNFITGGRSIDGAQNQISAMLGRARTEAIGLQEVRGLLFYIDPVNGRLNCTIVKQMPSKTVDLTTGPNVQVWLGLNDGADTLAL